MKGECSCAACMLQREQDEQRRRETLLAAQCEVVKILGQQIEREANAGKVRCSGCPLMVSLEFNAAEHAVVCSVAADRERVAQPGEGS